MTSIIPKIVLLSQENLMDELRLSLGKPPEGVLEEEYYSEKRKLFNEVLEKNKPCAMILYSEETEKTENNPIGYIEFFPKSLAHRLGIVCNNSKDTSKCLVISGLKVISKYIDLDLENNLLIHLLEYAKDEGYTKIELGAYPDEMQWQPISFYKKYGFKVVKTRKRGERKVYILEKYL